MNMKIDTLPNYRIAYVRQVGPYGPHNVKVMEKLKRLAKKKGLFTKDSIILSIAWDNPEETAPENCRYDAGIVISSEYYVDDDFSEDQLVGDSMQYTKLSILQKKFKKRGLPFFLAC
ncbi:GyrI-like domain-containing protein [Priestia megaterium]|nr:DNA gyrase inhibitor GyrI [Priestia megaterium]